MFTIDFITAVTGSQCPGRGGEELMFSLMDQESLSHNQEDQQLRVTQKILRASSSFADHLSAVMVF